MLQFLNLHPLPILYPRLRPPQPLPRLHPPLAAGDKNVPPTPRTWSQFNAVSKSSDKITSLSESDLISAKALNQKILNVADSAVDSIMVYGITDSSGIKAVKDLLKAYEAILGQYDVNIVNCVTMIHRVARVFSSLDGQQQLYSRASPLFGRLSIIISQKYDELDSFSISNLFWGFGKLGRRLLTTHGHSDAIVRLYSLLLKRTLELDTFQTQEIAAAVSGLGWMQFKAQICEEALEHLTSLAVTSFPHFIPQEYSNIIWGLGKVYYTPSNAFVDMTMKWMTEHVNELNPQLMSNSLWAIARLKPKQQLRELLPKFEEYFALELSNFDEQGLTVVPWSFAKIRYMPQESLLDAVDNVMSTKLSSCIPQAVMQYLYACATFSHPPPGHILTLINNYLRRKSNIPTQRLVLCLWSMAILFSLELDLFVDAMQTVTNEAIQQLRPAEKRQVYQVLIHVQFFVPGGNRALKQLSLESMRLCQEEWDISQRKRWRDSVCLSVFIELQRMGYIVEQQHLLSKGLARFLVDVIWEPRDSRRVVVDIIIPTQRFRNAKWVIEGQRQWARHLLTALDYLVLEIDSETWMGLESQRKTTYLQQQLHRIYDDPR